MDSDPEQIRATGDIETALSSQSRLLGDVDGQNMAPELVLPEIDWNSLQITGQDEEDRMEIVSEEQMCLMLGLRDEDERAQKREEDNQMVRAMRRTVQIDDTGGAAIPVVDSISDDIVIAYDKENPCMDIGTMYPTMKQFRMALRDFAIKREFKLGTEKFDKKRFRGFCKTRAECPWRIVAKRHADNTSIKVHMEPLS